MALPGARCPPPSQLAQVAHDPEVHWDGYVAYLVSFATLGLVWLEHHGMLLADRRTSRFFIEVIFGFLLFVAFLPWPPALTAQFAVEPTAPGLARSSVPRREQPSGDPLE